MKKFIFYILVKLFDFLFPCGRLKQKVVNYFNRENYSFYKYFPVQRNVYGDLFSSVNIIVTKF